MLRAVGRLMSTTTNVQHGMVAVSLQIMYQSPPDPPPIAEYLYGVLQRGPLDDQTA